MDRPRAGLGVDGLSGRRHAAADGRGRQLDCQWRRARRAARRARDLPGQPALRRDAEGRFGGRSAARPPHVMTTIMEQVVDARDREARADSRFHGRRKNGHRHEADRRALLRLRKQRVVRRLPPFARSGGGDHRGDRRPARRQRQLAAAWSPAPIFQRIAEATLRYLGVAAHDRSGAAGAGRTQRRECALLDRRVRSQRRSSASCTTDLPARFRICAA